MSLISKIDLHLTQQIVKTSNLKLSKKQILVGSLTENISYIENDPLKIKVDNKKENFHIDITSNSHFELHYIHRLQKTPFFVSYLSNENISIKILDFYDWRNDTSIYRLVLIKKINYQSSFDSMKLNLKSDSNMIRVDKNHIQINDVLLEISVKYEISNNELTSDLTTNSDLIYFAFKINFVLKNSSSITLDNLINKFFELEELCFKNHISNQFVTKNQKAEIELDNLWNQQKYMFPNHKIDNQIVENKELFDIERYWIDDFCLYFNYRNDIKYNINDSNKLSSNIFNDLPSKLTVLQYHKGVKKKNEDIAKDIQTWWDFYSFSLFDLIFKNKCIKEPEEVFAVYFLAIRLHLPWASILYRKIIINLKSEKLTHLHHFLFLLAFFYKRIIKISNKNNMINFVPGYKWDNNYKSIAKNIDISKFSKNIYIKLKNYIDFKINKLCEIQVEEKNNKIHVFPSYNKSFSDFELQNVLSIDIDEYNLGLPLIWENGFFEFNSLRFKWILKKNKFQITIYCTTEKSIKINNKKIYLCANKKTIHNIEIEKICPNLYINLYSNLGATILSKKPTKPDEVIISGFTTTKYGIINNKILYSSNLKKHQLFDLKDNYNNTKEIQLQKDIKQIKFYSKHAACSLEISYIKKDFLNRLVNLNVLHQANLVLLIDIQFKEDAKDILLFFQNNFSFRPEFILGESISDLQLKSNLIIEFKLIQNVSINKQCEFKDNNKLVLKGNNCHQLLKNLEKLIKNYKN